MREKGYFTLGRVRGVPVRLHFTAPIGLFAFSGFTFHPLLWAVVLAIILVHEAGHAVLVRRHRFRVTSIDVNGFGGMCRYLGQPTDRQRSVIAWGGVLAQGVLLLAALAALGLVSFVGHGGAVVGPIASMLVVSNAYIAVFNLLPVRPLDGADAWRLFRWRKVASSAKPRRSAPKRVTPRPEWNVN